MNNNNNNLHVTHTSMKVILVMFFVHSILQVNVAKAEENPVENLWSRDELVQLAGYGEERLSTVLVSGSLFCEGCFDGESQFREWPIPGALVLVKCQTGRKWGKTTKPIRAITDENGDFLVDLPSHLHAIPIDKACCVQVVNVPKNSSCKVPRFTTKHKGLTLLSSSSTKDGVRDFTSGKIKLPHFSSTLQGSCQKRDGLVKQFV